jgi:hypothetical protein
MYECLMDGLGTRPEEPSRLALLNGRWYAYPHFCGAHLVLFHGSFLLGVCWIAKRLDLYYCLDFVHASGEAD